MPPSLTGDGIPARPLKRRARGYHKPLAKHILGDSLQNRFKLTRLVRTHTSEIYLIWEGDRRVGQLDIHFAHDTIHATIIFESDLNVTDEEELMAQIDDDIVSSYMPRFEREDFVAHVFRGEEISRYTDCSGAIDDLEDEDEEEREE